MRTLFTLLATLLVGSVLAQTSLFNKEFQDTSLVNKKQKEIDSLYLRINVLIDSLYNAEEKDAAGKTLTSPLVEDFSLKLHRTADKLNLKLITQSKSLSNAVAPPSGPNLTSTSKFDHEISIYMGGASGLEEITSFLPNWRYTAMFRNAHIYKNQPRFVQFSIGGNLLGVPALDMLPKSIGFLSLGNELVPFQAYDLPELEQLLGAASLNASLGLSILPTQNTAGKGSFLSLYPFVAASVTPVRLRAAKDLVTDELAEIADQLADAVNDNARVEALKTIANVTSLLPIDSKLINFENRNENKFTERDDNQVLYFAGFSLGWNINLEPVYIQLYVQPQISLNRLRTSREVLSFNDPLSIDATQEIRDALDDLDIPVISKSEIRKDERGSGVVMPIGLKIDARLTPRTYLNLNFQIYKSLYRRDVSRSAIPAVIGLTGVTPVYVNVGISYQLNKR